MVTGTVPKEEVPRRIGTDGAILRKDGVLVGPREFVRLSRSERQLLDKLLVECYGDVKDPLDTWAETPVGRIFSLQERDSIIKGVKDDLDPEDAGLLFDRLEKLKHEKEVPHPQEHFHTQLTHAAKYASQRQRI
ncbi:MAG: hypothetical protein GF416_04760 [Candidatus Altiarchaeales archaeon]|nr:hypothetical protein [Candidatus Altiarchaeales archaeon]MBD3416431.1 hypothetical protein [Candidatus Altiarchaeales archaeon]